MTHRGLQLFTAMLHNRATEPRPQQNHALKPSGSASAGHGYLDKTPSGLRREPALPLLFSPERAFVRSAMPCPNRPGGLQGVVLPASGSASAAREPGPREAPGEGQFSLAAPLSAGGTRTRRRCCCRQSPHPAGRCPRRRGPHPILPVPWCPQRA